MSTNLLNKYPNWNAWDASNARMAINTTLEVDTSSPLIKDAVDALNKVELYNMLLAGNKDITTPTTEAPKVPVQCTGISGVYDIVSNDGKTSLNQCQGIQSQNGLFKFVLQSDGNAVLYKNDTQTSIWASNTQNSGDQPYTLALGDSKFTIQDSIGKSVYNKSVNGDKLYITNKGQ